ncbi:hypothetical protein [Aestuariivivens sediminicola]|uniref:hypothetical protein n=1 Tax=Aestuariivivens sediminicola TaxID=2913560 RepID=UPI001F589E01|nr:hypothetical protein [Aestuariivivens sediminicola]
MGYVQNTEIQTQLINSIIQLNQINVFLIGYKIACFSFTVTPSGENQLSLYPLVSPGV